MNELEQRKAAKAFAEAWRNKGDEKQHTQQFWSDLLHRVYGITNFSQRVEFEKRVPLLHTSFIDVYIPETNVLIEQKSMDVDLLKRKKQSDGSELNPFEQAQRYGARLPFSERPRWIVTCNFQKFVIYDMEAVRPEAKPTEILLEELPEKFSMLSFMVDASIRKITVEQELSFKAGELVGRLYDMMLPLYKDPTAESTLQSLNKLCVRIVFCLYAEDALLFGPKGTEFHDYLEGESNTRMALMRLFIILDQRENDREPYTEKVLMDFPYVNGGLFAENIEIPIIPDDVKNLILKDMSENLDWSKISPTIFGAVFESTLNPETRRKGGMHYTSVRNIHKVIDPLFLDNLEAEFDKILTDNMSGPRRRTALETFQNKLTTLYFLDPACGSGNFLTETFLSIRRLENRVIECLQKGQMVLEFANPVKVSIKQFAGIEINDFAVTVARTALWIAESQMIKETEAIVNQTIDFFPLKTDAKIVEGNALRMDWNDVMVVSKYALAYIMGNPPFVGFTFMSKEQKSDMQHIFPGIKNLDLVSAWYKKASDYIDGTRIECCFVSTNSITQGETVSRLWKNLDIKINFAYRSFIWDSEANNKAHVHCVIIGFSKFNKSKKLIFDKDTTIEAANINPYLMDAPDLLVESRNKPLCNVRKMIYGNKPADGGFLIIEDNEYASFISQEPQAKKYIRPLLGAVEYLHNKKRFCLWLENVSPAELKKCPLILDRVKKCKENRENSIAAGIRKFADTPTLFAQITQPVGKPYIIVPRVSSETRRYIPMGFIDGNTIASDAVQIIPDASLYDFGILESNVHMAWMRTVAGRLESRYRYSKDVVYNNFPWCTPTDQQREKIEKTAQSILDARANYPESSLADLYDETLMPVDLRKAHKANDRAVMEAYGMWGKVNSEAECVAWLFKMYEGLVGSQLK
ncbi:MAG: class I SAM-dependent DNA methyltransferase [Acidaminococcaceae bacterium]|nr:class I SAM-dependent DNA methyltransferase [Acidaminococcaceae bacterium]